MTKDASGSLAAPRHAATRSEKRSETRAVSRSESRAESPGQGRPEGRSARRAPGAPAEEERTVGMLTHGLTAVVTVLSLGSLGFLASLIVFLVYKDRGEFIRAHAANAVNVQIMTIFGLFFAVLLSVVGTVVAITVAAVILAVAVAIHLMGALRATRGEWWTPPLTPRMVK